MSFSIPHFGFSAPRFQAQAQQPAPQPVRFAGEAAGESEDIFARAFPPADVEKSSLNAAVDMLEDALFELSLLGPDEEARAEMGQQLSNAGQSLLDDIDADRYGDPATEKIEKHKIDLGSSLRYYGEQIADPDTDIGQITSTLEHLVENYRSRGYGSPKD